MSFSNYLEESENALANSTITLELALTNVAGRPSDVSRISQAHLFDNTYQLLNLVENLKVFNKPVERCKISIKWDLTRLS